MNGRLAIAMRELEVDRFVKAQMEIKVAMKVIFTQLERFLIKNNRAFVMKNNEKQSSDSSSETKSHRSLEELFVNLDKH